MSTSPDTDKQRKRVYSALTELLIGSITRREAIDRIFDILASQPTKVDKDELRTRILHDAKVTFEPYTEENKRTEHIVTINLNYLMKLIEHYALQRSREAEIAGALAAREVLNRECGIESNATPQYLIDRYAELTKRMVSAPEARTAGRCRPVLRGQS